MKTQSKNFTELRICDECKKPLGVEVHGNRKLHPECAYRRRLRHQKEKYRIGNSAKLKVQKNEKQILLLHKMDLFKDGYLLDDVLQGGLDFNCPTLTRIHNGAEVHFFDEYGFTLKRFQGKNLILFYHVSEL